MDIMDIIDIRDNMDIMDIIDYMDIIDIMILIAWMAMAGAVSTLVSCSFGISASIPSHCKIFTKGSHFF